MAGAPLVSHFVYAYRQEKTVRAAVESVLAQSYGPLEVILSDDASPDGTFAAMEAAAAAYRGPHRIVLNRNPENLGIARHVERIMALSRGDFVIESAGDDISLPDRAARLAGAWLASGRTLHMVHSEKRDLDADGTALPFRPREGVLAGIAPLDMLRKKHAIIGATSGWSRAVYDRFGPISGTAAFHDYPIAFRALLLGGVGFIEEPLVLYRRGGISRGNAGQALGRRQLYGDVVRYMRWDLEFFRAYRADMERVAPPEPEACRRLADLTIDRLAFTLALADGGYRVRLAALPAALRLARRHRDPAFLRVNAKYLLDRPLMRYMDWREARAMRAAAAAAAAEPAGGEPLGPA